MNTEKMNEVFIETRLILKSEHENLNKGPLFFSLIIHRDLLYPSHLYNSLTGQLTLQGLSKNAFSYANQSYLLSDNKLTSQKFSFCAQETIQKKFEKFVDVTSNICKEKYS